MRPFITFLSLLGLAIGVHADIVQLNTGKALAGRVTGYANDSFELQPTNAAPVQIPASTVASIDFSKGAVLATVELEGQKPLDGRIWLYTRGAINFENDKGETTRLPLAKISRVSFSADALPETPAPPPRPKPAPPANDSPAPVSVPKIGLISKGGEVDVQQYCVRGKIMIIDFYADWCPPCRSVGPLLEKRVNEDDDLILRKVDIVKWNSPVCQQYGIRSIPYIQVYDRFGNKVGDMTGFNEKTFDSYLNLAH